MQSMTVPMQQPAWSLAEHCTILTCVLQVINHSTAQQYRGGRPLGKLFWISRFRLASCDMQTGCPYNMKIARQQLESFGRGPALLAVALRQFPRQMWLYKTSPEKWSIHEII